MSLSEQLETAHLRGVSAASAGLQDPALDRLRLTGPAVDILADAAVSSATPFLRAPLLAMISRALVIHPPAGDADEQCPTCHTGAPCPTAEVLAC